MLAPDFIPGLLGWILDYFIKLRELRGGREWQHYPPFFVCFGNSELLETALMATVAGKREKILADANKAKTRTTTKKEKVLHV